MPHHVDAPILLVVILRICQQFQLPIIVWSFSNPKLSVFQRAPSSYQPIGKASKPVEIYQPYSSRLQQTTLPHLASSQCVPAFSSPCTSETIALPKTNVFRILNSYSREATFTSRDPSNPGFPFLAHARLAQTYRKTLVTHDFTPSTRL